MTAKWCAHCLRKTGRVGHVGLTKKIQPKLELKSPQGGVVAEMQLKL